MCCQRSIIYLVIPLYLTYPKHTSLLAYPWYWTGCCIGSVRIVILSFGTIPHVSGEEHWHSIYFNLTMPMLSYNELFMFYVTLHYITCNLRLHYEWLPGMSSLLCFTTEYHVVVVRYCMPGYRQIITTLHTSYIMKETESLDSQRSVS